jgi:hypothetical protein
LVVKIKIYSKYCHLAMPWLRRLVAGLLPQRPGFSSCKICGGHIGSGTFSPPNSSVFPCQYHSTLAPRTHISSRDEQWGPWLPQFRDIVSPYRLEQQVLSCIERFYVAVINSCTLSGRFVVKYYHVCAFSVEPPAAPLPYLCYSRNFHISPRS